MIWLHSFYIEIMGFDCWVPYSINYDNMKAESLTMNFREDLSWVVIVFRLKMQYFAVIALLVHYFINAMLPQCLCSIHCGYSDLSAETLNSIWLWPLWLCTSCLPIKDEISDITLYFLVILCCSNQLCVYLLQYMFVIPRGILHDEHYWNVHEMFNYIDSCI